MNVYSIYIFISYLILSHALYHNIHSTSISNKYIRKTNSYTPPPRYPPSKSMLYMIDTSDNETSSNANLSNNINEINENLNNNDNIISKQWKKLSQETKDDIKTSFLSFAFALLVRIVLIEPRFIPSLSMYPTFDIGDQLLVDKISHVTKNYQKRDVVVFNPTDTYMEMTGNTEALIKRVVAVAGDIVEVKNNHLYINGEIQEEEYINELPDYDLKPMKVPAGMLLVLGDNRNHSFDSHVWGFLPEKNVIGRAVLKYWPPWRISFIEGSY